MASTPQVTTPPRMQTPRREPRGALAEKQAGVSADVRPLLSHRKAFEDAWSFVNHCKSEHETLQRKQQLHKRTEECVRLRQRGVMVQKQGDESDSHTCCDERRSPCIAPSHAPRLARRAWEEAGSEEERSGLTELPSWSTFCGLDEPVQFECQSARGLMNNAEPELCAESCITCTTASVEVIEEEEEFHGCKAMCSKTLSTPVLPTVVATQLAHRLTTPMVVCKQASMPSIPRVRQLTVVRHSSGSSVQPRQATVKPIPSTARVTSKPLAATVRDNPVIANMPVGAKMASPPTSQHGTTVNRVPSQTMLQMLPMFSRPDTHHQMSFGSLALKCLSSATAR